MISPPSLPPSNDAAGLTARPPRRLRSQLLAISATRTVLNTGFRMVYPFLPVFARSLGVSLETMALAVTARSLLGVFTPGLGALADVRGRRWTMRLGLGLFILGMALVPLYPRYGVVFAALIIAMAGKLIFDPAMQAYVGDRVAYARRGLAIAITELGWSSAGLIGIPVVGWIIATYGWTAPFPVLAALGLFGWALLGWIIPSDSGAPSRHTGLSAGLRKVAAYTPALAGLGLSLITTAANESINIIYGAWLEDSFGLQVLALGAASTVIGLAELSGEGVVAVVSDRLGKRRLVALFIMLNALACLGVPLLGRSVPGALVSLFLFYITFEVLIVAAIPMMTEILPSARATVMAANVAALSLGRAVGALAGPALFRFGMGANVSLAVVLDLVALVLLITLVRVDETPPTDEEPA
jgi:MFS transporter, DHA1 family, inner membrane transport protein